MSIEFYTNLITSEHKQKPKFKAMVEANVAVFSRIQDILISFLEKMDVDIAVGEQLDFIGQWVGVSRFINTPITGIYFEWSGAASVGWSFGTWQGEFSPSSGLTSLPDDAYRTLIKAKIASNSWNGSIPDAYRIWETLFENNTILIQDNQDMTMTVAIVGAPIDTLTLALLTGGYLFLKPEGVRINYFVQPANTGPMFAWGAEESDALGGWGTGSWGSFLTPT